MTKIGDSKFGIKHIFALSLIVLLITGCAHPIVIAPTLSNVQAHTGDSNKINAAVGYYIPESTTDLEVTTPGGGGDNVRYYPYRDIESGYQAVLASVFRSVSKVSVPSPNSEGGDNLDYVIEPVIVTNSGSTGFFTWPPTNFSIDITNQIRNSSGQLVDSPRVVGIGTAETGERLSEHGIAGRRAMEDALVKMRTSLRESKLGTKSTKINTTTPIATPTSDAQSRLIQLLELKNKGLITPQEYEAKKKTILDGL
jgi:hypothetical protein